MPSPRVLCLPVLRRVVFGERFLQDFFSQTRIFPPEAASGNVGVPSRVRFEGGSKFFPHCCQLFIRERQGSNVRWGGGGGGRVPPPKPPSSLHIALVTNTQCEVKWRSLCLNWLNYRHFVKETRRTDKETHGDCGEQTRRRQANHLTGDCSIHILYDTGCTAPKGRAWYAWQRYRFVDGWKIDRQIDFKCW